MQHSRAPAASVNTACVRPRQLEDTEREAAERGAAAELDAWRAALLDPWPGPGPGPEPAEPAPEPAPAPEPEPEPEPEKALEFSLADALDADASCERVAAMQQHAAKCVGLAPEPARVPAPEPVPPISLADALDADEPIPESEPELEEAILEAVEAMDRAAVKAACLVHGIHVAHGMACAPLPKYTRAWPYAHCLWDCG
jgi:hypothetical protein